MYIEYLLHKRHYIKKKKKKNCIYGNKWNRTLLNLLIQAEVLLTSQTTDLDFLEQIKRFNTKIGKKNTILQIHLFLSLYRSWPGQKEIKLVLPNSCLFSKWEYTTFFFCFVLDLIKQPHPLRLDKSQFVTVILVQSM